ncbi:MAG: aromatic amino acid lyase [Deltaproteobacteria bacterium]|nr:aromatic amino acid lyase [Deltaproteobacteria bacterium]
MENKIFIDGNSLSLSDVEKVSFKRVSVEPSPKAVEKVRKTRNYIEKILQGPEVVYGLNTGFGSLSDKKINKEDLQTLQENLVRSHCAGIGKSLDLPIVRALILLRANVLCKGLSGVRPSIIDALCHLLNLRLHPVIYEQGSVGASGDLAPLAQLALCLMGEGRVKVSF